MALLLEFYSYSFRGPAVVFQVMSLQRLFARRSTLWRVLMGGRVLKIAGRW